MEWLKLCIEMYTTIFQIGVTNFIHPKVSQFFSNEVSQNTRKKSDKLFFLIAIMKGKMCCELFYML